MVSVVLLSRLTLVGREASSRGRSVVKEAKVRIGNNLEVAPREFDGSLVREAELGSAVAQRFYRMRCQCGRSWIELELKKLVKCPACSRLDQVLAASGE